MIYSPGDEQTLILEALNRLCARFRTLDLDQAVQHYIYSDTLRAELADSGFLDIGVEDPAAAASSALVIAELAKMPLAVELTGSVLVRPAAFADSEGPVALVFGDPLKPARFLPVARTACLVGHDDVRVVRLEPGDVVARDGQFAYPIGQLSSEAVSRSTLLDPTIRETVLRWWRIGTALEIYGALDSAMELTLEHVRERRQFGRPLGAFQAVQHRLAMSATAIQATRWLAMSAVFSVCPASAAMALGYAQDTARSVAYDLHQFSGAMGLTLEYPLHLYTYRTKWLQSELGGSRSQFAAASDRIWPLTRNAA